MYELEDLIYNKSYDQNYLQYYSNRATNYKNLLIVLNNFHTYSQNMVRYKMKPTAIPEQKFFNDPALDRAFGVVMALATEVYVLRDRQREIEKVLASQGVLDLETLNTEPSDEERAATQLDRNEFVNHLMESLSGYQVSKGLK